MKAEVDPIADLGYVDYPDPENESAKSEVRRYGTACIDQGSWHEVLIELGSPLVLASGQTVEY
jgi:hypothetical protein